MCRYPTSDTYVSVRSILTLSYAVEYAPVSLAGSLEEYLNDPNFEQNRIEYKTNKEAADRNVRNGVKSAPISKAAEKGMSTTAMASIWLQTNASHSYRVQVHPG